MANINEIIEGHRLSDDVIVYGMEMIKSETGIDYVAPAVQMVPGCIIRNQSRRLLVPLYDGTLEQDGHWSVLYFNGNNVVVYDSASRGYLNSHEKSVLKALFGADVQVHFAKMQQNQANTYDCGVFALAYCIELSLGNNPCSFRFETGCMREFLYYLLIEGKLEPFPRLAVLGVGRYKVGFQPSTGQALEAPTGQALETPTCMSGKDSGLLECLKLQVLELQPLFNGLGFSFNVENPAGDSNVAFIHFQRSMGADGPFYSLLYRAGEGIAHIYDFVGRRDFRHTSSGEKATVRRYTGRDSRSKLFPVCKVTVDRELRSFRLCIAASVHLALGVGMDHFRVDHASVPSHLATILRNDALSVFPYEEPLVDEEEVYARFLEMVNRAAAMLTSGTAFQCQRHVADRQPGKFIEIIKLHSRTVGHYYGVLAYHGSGKVFVYRFFDQRATLLAPEKEMILSYLGSTVSYQVVKMKQTPSHNVLYRTLRLAAATMVSIAMGGDPSEEEYDFSAAYAHLEACLLINAMHRFPLKGVERAFPQSQGVPVTPPVEQALHRIADPVAHLTTAITVPRLGVLPTGTSSMGTLTVECPHCHALSFQKEPATLRKLCCQHGQIKIPLLGRPEEYLRHLLEDDDEECIHYRGNTRSYNNALAFAAIEMQNYAAPGQDVRNRKTYIVQGQAYMSMYEGASMAGEAPARNQVWFTEGEDSINHRMHQFRLTRRNVVKELLEMLYHTNPFAKGYRSLANFLEDHGGERLRCRLIFDINQQQVRRANPGIDIIPTGAEVAAIYRSDEDLLGLNLVCVRAEPSAQKTRISCWNPVSDSLLYPLIFTKGEVGFAPDNNLREPIKGKRKNISVNEHYLFRVAQRTMEPQMTLSGKLFQQYIVMAQLNVEQKRLYWIRNHQVELRAASYQGLQDYLRSAAEATNRQIGKIVILPVTFKNGKRYRYQRYMDALAGIRVFGYYDLFVTFTCNPNWPEIKSNLRAGQHYSDRPDLGCRVFQSKLREFLTFVKNNKVFGPVAYYTYVIEFQKRGLPHAHIVITLVEEARIVDASRVDECISAEIPSVEDDLELRDLVLNLMIHQPCSAKPSNPCRNGGDCRFKFPKQVREGTSYDGSSWPLYRRRECAPVRVGAIEVTNADVVPYNGVLLKRFGCHINVEAYSPLQGLAYLYKYLHKGVNFEEANYRLDDEGNPAILEHDEVADFEKARYLSSFEAYWHLAGFKLYGSTHTVMRLPVHLERGQSVLFMQGNEEQALRDQATRHTHLTNFFEVCRRDPRAKDLTYVDFPHHYTWDAEQRVWHDRKRRNAQTIVRINDVPPRYGDLYFLRLLLYHVRCPLSFEDLRTFDGRVYPTYKEAAEARGVVLNDGHYLLALEQAQTVLVPSAFRRLFAQVVVYCTPTNPNEMYRTYEKTLIQDWNLRLRNIPRAVAIVQTLLKRYIERMDGDLKELRLDLPYAGDYREFPELMALLGDDLPESEERCQVSEAPELDSLNAHQREFAIEVTRCIEGCYNREGSRAFFLDGPAGTGKTFVLNYLHAVASIRGEVISCAWSGIAATLLKGGRTCHSVFRLPLKLDESSSVCLELQSEQARSLREAILIVIDEISMVNKHAIRAVDEFLRTLCSSGTMPFGGKVIIFSGDMRQLLPVVEPGVSPVTMVAASLPVWAKVSRHALHANMRVDDDERQFSDWLLNIGDGRERPIKIPQECLVFSLKELIRKTFFHSELERPDMNAVILAIYNKDVDLVNDTVSSMVEGESRVYLSHDIHLNPHEIAFHPQDLNKTNPSGFPAHRLVLKVGQPLLILRNLDISGGVCNGTRVLLLELHDDFLKCRVLVGPAKGQTVAVFRMRLTSSTDEVSFERVQFPVRVAYAATVHKSQGQTIDRIGLYLTAPVFCHGMAYVALSRVRSSRNLMVFVKEHLKQGTFGRETSIVNVVNESVLSRP